MNVKRFRPACFAIAFALDLYAPFAAFPQTSPPPALADASLEELMDIEVTSVSRKEQKLSKTAAAVYLIDQEDIRRSGATNIPDLLRMAPGVDVAQIDAGHWAISIRGFSSLYADKVLLLIDGRSAYLPTFSGVDWEQIDLPLEDIERIEVIRGPSGTIWANAMNGVINIITKSAKNTRGGLVTASAGSQTNAGGLVQYGGALGSSGDYRVFHKYFNTANAASAGQDPAADASHGFHEGFRTDWNLSPRNGLTVQGDFLQTEGGDTLANIVFSNKLPLTATVRDNTRYAGGNVLARWNHTLSNGSDMSLQVYDDYYVRTTQGMRESSNTFDLDFQHHLAIGSRQDVVWGFGSRTAQSNLPPGYNTRVLPPRRTDNLLSAFIQDEIRIADSLSLTLGLKFEHNSYTGFEYEPSAQLAWQATSRHTLWVSAARAIRQPSRLDFGPTVDTTVLPQANGGFGVVQVQAAQHVEAEQLLDYELGHRVQLNRRFSIDTTAFLSFYRHLGAYEPGAPFFTVSEGPPHLVLPLVLDYQAHANNYGAEIFASWSVNHRWKLSPGFSVLHMNVVDPSGQGQTVENQANSPRHTFEVRSFLNLSRNLDWDTSLSSVGPVANTPGYTRLDTRLGWRLRESLELSVVGQNLLTPRHAEFPNQDFIEHTLVERSVSAKIAWRF
jgi:iron complex outermembrane recepter protein